MRPIADIGTGSRAWMKVVQEFVSNTIYRSVRLLAALGNRQSLNPCRCFGRTTTGFQTRIRPGSQEYPNPRL